MVSLHIFYLPHEKQEALKVARELSDLYNYSVHLDLASKQQTIITQSLEYDKTTSELRRAK